MPVLAKGALRIDYTDEGQGQPVVAIHRSVSANRQWRALTEACPHWSFRYIAEGRPMAPLVLPEIVNSVVRELAGQAIAVRNHLAVEASAGVRCFRRGGSSS